jgi:hypothetical protein
MPLRLLAAAGCEDAIEGIEPDGGVGWASTSIESCGGFWEGVCVCVVMPRDW